MTPLDDFDPGFDPAAEERLRSFLEGRAAGPRPAHGHHVDDADELGRALKREKDAGPAGAPDWHKHGKDAPDGWRKRADGEYEEVRHATDH